MAKNLLVVESPAKAKTLSKYLGKDFVVRATIGHIKDLPPDSIGVNVEKDFEPRYEVIKGKNKVILDIRKAAEGVEDVYLGSDPDREGEAIAWHVAEEIQRGRKKSQPAPVMHRVLFHEITKNGVLKALGHPVELDAQRYESQLTRRILDRLVGYELSPLLWKKVSAGLSAGRVQSVAVAVVVDREREIQGFVSQEFWVVRAKLLGANPPEFEARLVRIGGEKATVPSDAEAKPLLETLRKATYAVRNLVREEKRKSPPPPLITSTLQQDAHRLYRFSAKRTMALAQQLYEGIDLGPLGTNGLITYMRTDSTRLADEAVDAVRAHILESFGPNYLPASPNRYKNKKSAQDAHEAIRPTSTEFSPEVVAPYLDKDMVRLYRLIWNRFVACQMAPAVYDVTQVTVEADKKYEFEATGRVLLFDGYLRLSRDPEAAEGEEPDAQSLPQLSVGEALKLLSVDGEQNFTQPPPRFTEGTLVKELEKRGIGRPSTYATILSTVQDKKYVEKDAGKFRPTDLGFVVTDLLREHFPDVMEVGFTAQMEEELDKVEEGAGDRLSLLKQFYGKFRADLDAAKEKMKNVKREPEKTDIACPRCQAPMVIRFGKSGSFLACSAFPNCRSTLPFKRDDKGKPVPVQETHPEGDETCELCSKPMSVRDGRFGRFWACTNYPTCKGTKPYATTFVCPREGCSGKLVERKSQKAKTFFRCSVQTCDFVLFGKPVATPCPECNHTYLEEGGRGRTRTLKCPKCGAVVNPGEASE